MGKSRVYSIWRDPDGDLTMVPGTDPPRFANGDYQSHGCTKLHQFEASSFEHACETLRRYQESDCQGDG